MSANAIASICNSFSGISIRRKSNLFSLTLLTIVIKGHPSAPELIIAHSGAIIFNYDFAMFFVRNGNTYIVRTCIPRICNKLRERNIIVGSDRFVVSEYVVFFKINRTVIHNIPPTMAQIQHIPTPFYYIIARTTCFFNMFPRIHHIIFRCTPAPAPRQPAGGFPIGHRIR